MVQRNAAWMLQITSTGLHCVRVWCVDHKLIHRQDRVYLKNVCLGPPHVEIKFSNCRWDDHLAIVGLICYHSRGSAKIIKNNTLTQSLQDTSTTTMITTLLQMCMFCCARSFKINYINLDKRQFSPVHVWT